MKVQYYPEQHGRHFNRIACQIQPFDWAKGDRNDHPQVWRIAESKKQNYNELTYLISDGGIATLMTRHTSIDNTAPRDYLQHAKGFMKADVYITRLTDGTAVICKDYSRFASSHLAAGLARLLVRREHAILSKLDSWPHAPRVYPCGTPFILVQEYISGGTLAHSKTASATIYRQLFIALSQLHRMGVAHNDIRATNVVYRRNGQPVLIDFASACRLPRLPGMAKAQRLLQFFDLRHLIKIKRKMRLPLSQRETRFLADSVRQGASLDFWKKGILPHLHQLASRRYHN